MQRGSTTSYNTTEQNYCWYSYYSILLLHSSYGSVRNMEKSVCVCLSFKRTPFNAGSGTGSLGLTSGLEFPQRYMTYRICHLITSLLTITVTNLKALQSKKCFFLFYFDLVLLRASVRSFEHNGFKPAWVWWGRLVLCDDGLRTFWPEPLWLGVKKKTTTPGHCYQKSSCHLTRGVAQLCSKRVVSSCSRGCEKGGKPDKTSLFNALAR